MNCFRISLVLILTGLGVMQQSCLPIGEGESQPRLVMFVGVDISGSFTASPHYDDSIRFLAHYIYFHLKGLGGLEVPHSLFVGSLGGSTPGEVKTLFPIQTFQDRNIQEIQSELGRIFPKEVSNPYTDFNAFFEKAAETIKAKKLILKPISFVLLSDGKPDFPVDGKFNSGPATDNDYRKINLSPLEQLSRNVTVRLLYTDPQTGKAWQTRVPRKRIKIWTQEAEIMTRWKDSKTLTTSQNWESQTKLFEWIQENVDYAVRSKRVD